MSIMVSREDCVKTINKFIETKNIKDAVVLFEYLCDIKNPPNKEEAMKAICSNPTVLSVVLPQTIEELSIELKINKISDKNNTLITVY